MVEEKGEGVHHYENKETSEPAAHHEHREGHQEHHYHKKKLNLWKVFAFGLMVLLIISLLTDGLKKWGGDLSQEEAAQQTLAFVNDNLLQGKASATIKLVSEENGLYLLNMDVSGQELNTYVTKDGQLFFPQGIKVADLAGTSPTPTTPAPTATNLPKTDKPKVELFVMSHCPYGTQAEKGLIPVMEKLGSKADIEIKFVYYAMHGEKEVKEQMNQVCINNEQKDKFLPYLKCFLNAGDGTVCLDTAKVDKTKLDTCVKALDAQYKITENFNKKETWLSGNFPLFDVYKADNDKYQVGGSPTLIINGAESSSGRSPDAYLKSICAAFTTQPAECQTSLSTTTYQAGFGYDAGANAVAAGCEK